MTLSDDDLAELADIALAAATEAGEYIAASRPDRVDHKDSGDSVASQVVTEIDHRSEAIIVDHLEPTLATFGLGLLTEERVDDGGRFSNDHFWCVDPLDGTLPFIEGRAGYAVSIALVGHDGTPRIGVVHDPVTDTTVHAIASTGAWRDGEPWQPDLDASGTALTVFADRSFADYEALRSVAQQVGLAGVEFRVGSGAAMNALGVLGHAPACYIKLPKAAGGGSLWDFAATACIFAEVGAIATDIHGQALDLNRADSTFMHHRGVLFATDATIANAIWHRAATLRTLPPKETP